jgi:DNA-nicking Smr family endonuclease
MMVDHKNISDDDKIAWQEFLSDNSPLIKQTKHQEETKPNKKALIDLHGLNSEQAYNLIAKNLIEARENNIKELLIITGIGALKLEKRILYNKVPQWLKKFLAENYIKKFYRNKKNLGEIIVKI